MNPFLPMSCTSEMVEAFHGFSKSGNSFECSVCMRECDEDDFRKHQVTTTEKGHTYWSDVCSECVTICDVCGEFMDRETADRGPLVNYREVANDGKLTHGHAECVGEWMSEVSE